MTQPIAILSTSDKKGVVALGRGLSSLGWSLAATSGTRSELAASGVKAVDVAALAGTAEMFDGRIKTLSTPLFGGILFRRDVPEDRAQTFRSCFPDIALVACNFYPFPEPAKRTEDGVQEALRSLDVGGPAMIRAAAKNYAHVLPLANPRDYAQVLAAIEMAGGDPRGVPLALRRELALRSFMALVEYDRRILSFFEANTPYRVTPD